jgi:RimJ/RimL family protein N-acetyltransferase
MGGMEPLVELDLGDLRLRALTVADDDAALLVQATRAESASALWGPRPAGPYSLEAARSALRAWDPRHGRQVSFGVLDGPRLVAALGLMPDGPHSAELAYWVRPEDRRRGIALRSVQALTSWAHTTAGFPRIWLEIDPANSRRAAGWMGSVVELWARRGLGIVAAPLLRLGSGWSDQLAHLWACDDGVEALRLRGGAR